MVFLSVGYYKRARRAVGCWLYSCAAVVTVRVVSYSRMV